MPYYLERYIHGDSNDCEKVWSDLLELGDLVRQEPYHTQAIGVARETMRRARHNIEQLIIRLENIGYKFGYSWADKDQAVRAQQEPPRLGNPEPDMVERFDALEHAGAFLPLSLRAFYEVIGAVNFVGARTPAMDRFEFGAAATEASEYIDEDLNPLYVLSLDPALTPEAFKRWQSTENSPFKLPITHSAERKYFMGGGISLIDIPNLQADMRLLFKGGNGMTFVQYLRYAIQNGGLPPTGNTRILEDKTITYLTRDLLPM